MAVEVWYDALRWAHLLAGIFAFLIAPIILLRRKGTRSHRVLGRLYLWPMSFAAASAAVLAGLKGNTTFVFIGIFSLYLGVSGFRALAFKSGHSASPLDKLILVAAMVFFTAMLLYAFTQISQRLGVAIPLLSFGTVGIVLAAADWRRLNERRGDHDWFFGHMTGMVASYIAAVSAFSVVNLAFLPLPVRILWPALVGIPMLLVTRRVWSRRLSRALLQAHVELRA